MSNGVSKISPIPKKNKFMNLYQLIAQFVHSFPLCWWAKFIDYFIFARPVCLYCFG